ncbi:hypothetical protein FRB94_013486 [Tulasnella sp. JGI-2019a]|nr:hypothetical protein FRB93_007750 [Tulasnella sp. JGI-2019a]KAG8990307.1 hypothetical protein FRB94_013486 [Tulasnella sp. JGI-2019a]KAG9021643.1 hypothetical protein FRB95_001722 [Tulasnella sp. JGI-2019a]
MSYAPPVQPPPYHPPLTTAAVSSPSSSSEKASKNPHQAKIDQAEHSLGDLITGVWNTVHGAGEALRGNILKGVDTVTGDSKDGVGETIAESGWAEINDGQQKVRSGSHHA